MRRTVLVWYLLNYFKVTICLRVVGVTVPTFKQRGETATLGCDFDLEGGKLYSVKWYRDHEEFYRYMPKLRPPQHAHKVDGIKVDVTTIRRVHTERAASVEACRGRALRGVRHTAHTYLGCSLEAARSLDKSSARRVHLKDLSLKSRGLYRCEVSKEAPSFHSAQAEAFMEVYYFPREGPRIAGHERPYSPGEPLDVNCSFARAFPAPELQWHIDGHKVTERAWLIPYGAMPAPQGLLVTTLGLRAPAHRLMQLSCVAVMGTHRRERTVIIEINSSSTKKAFSFIVMALLSINIRFYDKIL